jgi:hypothetical protein
LQFSLQAASPEAFGYTLVSVLLLTVHTPTAFHYGGTGRVGNTSASAYADDVNLFGENMNVINKKHE